MKKIFLQKFLCLLPLFYACLLHAQENKLETIVQKGHSASVKAVAISPDGRFLVTGSRDRTAKLWDLQTGMEMRTYNGHEHTVNGVQFSPNGKYLATSSADNTFRVWNVLNGKQIFVSPVAEKYMTDIAFSPDSKYLIGAGYSDSASVYEIPSGKFVKNIAVNADQGSGYGVSVEYSPDGKWLAIGEDNKTVNVYHLPDWKLTYTFKPSEGWCGGCGTLVSFSADSKYLLKLSHNAKAEQYDLQSGKLITQYGEELDEIAGIEMSKDSKKIVVAGDKKLIQYEMLSAKILSSISVDSSGELNEAIYNNDASLVIAAFGSNKAIAYNAANGKEQTSFSGILNQQDKGGLDYNPDNYYESYIAKYLRLKNLLLITKDDRFFITGKTGTSAVKWSTATGKPERAYRGHSKAVICFDLSKDGKYLLTGDGNGEAILWETESGKKIRSYKGHKEPLFDVKISPDGNSIVTVSWDASMIVWNLETGEKTSYTDFREYSAYTVAFSPDGLYLVTGRLNKMLELREPDSKEIVRTFIGHTDVISSIDFGPEKYKMLSASWDGTARIWDISTGMMVQKFKVSKTAVHSAIYTPDGKRVITGGDDRVIRIFDVASGKLLKTLEGHQAEISCIRISQDGKMLVSYSVDGVIKCWNLDKGVEFYEHMHLGERDWMARTKDGYFNATAGARSAVHFVKGLEVYQPEQFFEEYYRPDIIPEMYKSRGASEGRQKIEDKLNQAPPPELKIALVPIEGNTEVEVHMKVTDIGGGVSEVRLMHNGKLLPVSTEELTLPAGKGNFTTFTKTYSLVAGTNTFSASGFSKGRVESIPVEAKMFSENAVNASICHVFAIGIDKYKNPSMSLNFARDDAEAFVDSIRKGTGNLFQKTEIHTLYDEKATRQAVLDTLEALSKKIAPQDVFLFYYAGHGSMTEDKFYFITHECTRLYDPLNLEKNAISDAEMQDKLKHIKALKQIIIMDACQSGGSVELLAMRGSMEEKAIAQLSRSAGIHVLASAGSEQNAKEIAQLGHGLFTYVLLKAMSGAADGAPDDGKITIYELKSYLDDQVPELNRQYSGKIQYPYTFSRGHDFPIVFE
ncbi:MAG TPA: caspase family protein [Cytophagaceae bacterium]|nr:caspase family protein [Cytophagaceae bacterium]